MHSKSKILIADDSEINRSMLSDMLSDEYELLEAKNGLEAVACLNHYHSDISLILLDIVMPKMDGFEVLSMMNKQGWIDNVPVIIISAETSSTYIDHAYDLGAVEYINRPFDEKTVNRRVKNTIMLYTKQKLLQNMVTEQIMEKEKNSRVMVDILSHIVEFRNGESGRHVLHIRIITEVLLKQLIKMGYCSMSADQIAMISNASALHDIGKISIPDEILNKPGRLTKEEYEIMKTHSAIGAQILENTPYHQKEALLKTARDICRWHHERYDGNGYPDGLKGDEIPISAQVVSIADVYDALTSVRVYKPAYSHETALQMILNGECGVFNPILLKCLQEVWPHLEKEMTTKSEPQEDAKAPVFTLDMLHNSSASSRTLALLEQERIKYQFFASMSKEIQFEYVYRSDILTISEWGAKQLGITEIIAHPKQDEELAQLFQNHEFEDLWNRLSNIDIEDPIITHIYCLNVKGRKRWYKLIARPLWVLEETHELTGVIGKFIDIHDEQVELDKLKYMLKYDRLTDIYNRSYAFEVAKKALAEGMKEGKTYAMLLFNIDSFKTINEQYGHLQGDKVLQQIADRLKETLKGNDMIARIDGDEFFVFLEYEADIAQIVEQLYKNIHIEYKGLITSISMGISLSKVHGSEFEELFHHAEQALAYAKQHGKKQYCFYEEFMHDMLN